MTNEASNTSAPATAGGPETGMPEGVQPQNEGEQATYGQLLLTLQDAQAKADDHWNQLLLARAELENTRRRAQRDVESAHKYALEKFVNELLPVKDSMEMGLAAANNAGAEIQKVREGMELTLRILSSAFEKFGVKEENPLGVKFNPERHQAMTMQPAPGVEPNTVTAVFQKGYLLNDRLIRPAMVVVSTGVAGPDHENKGMKIDEKA